MKYMNMKERFSPLNLQLFAEGEDGDEGSDGDDTGGDDQNDDDDSDEGGDDGNSSEKKYTEEEMEAAVKKRLARERRKWKREHNKQQDASGGKDSGNDNSEKDGSKDDKHSQELRDKAARVDELELKWTCLEHDVDKAYVDDVLALAKTRVAKDKDLDIEDAIDEVLKKYPHFKESSKRDDNDDDSEPRGRSWGQRQSGQRKKKSGVEAAFLKKNPGLKID